MTDIPQDQSTSVTVTIFRENFQISGKTDPVRMQALAEYVDQRMREISSKVPKMPYQRVAILTALNITAELFDLRDGHRSAQLELDQLDRASQELLLLLEERSA